MNKEERFQKLPNRIKRTVIFLKKIHVPATMVYIMISILGSERGG